MTTIGLPQQGKSRAACFYGGRESGTPAMVYTITFRRTFAKHAYQAHGIFRTLTRRQQQSSAHAAHASAIKQKQKSKNKKKQALRKTKYSANDRASSFCTPVRQCDCSIIKPYRTQQTLRYEHSISRRPPLQSRYHQTIAGHTNNHKHRIRHPLPKLVNFPEKIHVTRGKTEKMAASLSPRVSTTRRVL